MALTKKKSGSVGSSGLNQGLINLINNHIILILYMIKNYILKNKIKTTNMIFNILSNYVTLINIQIIQPV